MPIPMDPTHDEDDVEAPWILSNAKTRRRKTSRGRREGCFFKREDTKTQGAPGRGAAVR